MKVILERENRRIVLSEYKDTTTVTRVICSDPDDYYTSDDLSLMFDICSTIPLDIATKLFQRWHQIDQSAEPEVIARALDDALNCEPYVKSTQKIYNYGVSFSSEVYDLDNLVECIYIHLNGNFSRDRIGTKLNITEDRVDYFIDGKLKGWLPVVRGEL